MRIGYAVLLSSLLLSLMGCRELGSYLSPRELEDCESGTRTEGCPSNLEPGATVTFQPPHVLQVGEAYALPGLGRYLELRLRVESALDIERVDLACQGLQLASWRPREPGLSLDLEALVDLLPCRSVSTSELVDDVELHTVPLEVRVLGPVGGQVVLGGWEVVVNLKDATVPDSRAGIELTLESAFPNGAPLGGRSVEFRATPADPNDPLQAPPEVWVDGVRVADAIARADGSQGSYLVQLPRGLRTRHDSGSSLEELLAPKLARLMVTGTTQSGRNSVGRLTVPVEKDRSNPENEPELRNLFFGDAVGLPVTRPVAVPPAAGAQSPGTLVLPGYLEEFNLYLFNADDVWVPVPERSGGEVFAFTARGQVIWQEEPWVAAGVLQTDLSEGAPPGPMIEIPEPAISERAFRLGDGSVCVEDLEGPTSPVACGDLLMRWRVQCLQPDASTRSVDLAAFNPINRGEPWATVGLQAGWVSARYAPPVPGCSPSQAVGGWGTHAIGVNFLDPEVEAGLLNGERPVLLSAGPEQAVVGHINTDFSAHLELIDVAGGGRSLGHYFAPPASAWLSMEDAVLWADADGGLVLLRATGVLERWLPGAASPAQTFPLGSWAGGEVLSPHSTHMIAGERLFELPRVVHGNGDVSTALILVGADQQIHLLTLELNRDLVPVWAHQVPLDADTPQSSTVMPVGLPDGPYLDVAVWGLSAPSSRVFRWAR